MHEAGIALSTIEAIKDIEKSENIKVQRVIIEVGHGSGVNVSSLSFCLEQISASERLNIVFDIRPIPIKGYCKECNENITLNNLTYVCPICKNPSLEIINGTELIIKEVEGENIES